MENSLKQRIVGAVVLIALAVIFLPSILKEKTNPAPFKTKIPAKPIESVETKLSDEVIEKNKQTQVALDNLDEKLKRKTKSVESETRIASKEVASKEVISKVIQTKANNEQSKAERVKADATKEIIDKNEVPQTIGEQFKDAAWVIQIASLSSKENAVALVNKLKKAGYKAYRRKAKNKQGKSILRIFVGPYIKKMGAQKALPKVNKLSSLSGIVLPFDPINH